MNVERIKPKHVLAALGTGVAGVLIYLGSEGSVQSPPENRPEVSTEDLLNRMHQVGSLAASHNIQMINTSLGPNSILVTLGRGNVLNADCAEKVEIDGSQYLRAERLSNVPIPEETVINYLDKTFSGCE